MAAMWIIEIMSVQCSARQARAAAAKPMRSWQKHLSAVEGVSCSMQPHIAVHTFAFGVDSSSSSNRQSVRACHAVQGCWVASRGLQYTPRALSCNRECF